MWKVSLLALALTTALMPFAGCAQLPGTSSYPAPAQFVPYTAKQLDNLLAPIALYPDPLLAQVLIAATFPDQIDKAARWVRSFGDNGIDDQPWDASVRSVAHYATVIYMMDDDLDWTTAVGQAYAYQSTDVMASIQRLRAMARSQGNLVATPQQEVIVEAGYISIWPASATYIYVPVYDPSIVFFRPVYFDGSFTAFSFGTALAIGVWLNLDCDWRHHRVYYTGWHGSGWIARSRSHVRISEKYVNPRFATIVINHHVGQRPVDYTVLSRYRGVHPRVNFSNRPRQAGPQARPENRLTNKIIDRNIPPNQSLAPFRGRETQPAVPRPPPRIQPRPQGTAPGPQHPASKPPQSGGQVPAQTRPATRPPNAFGRGDALFDSNAASRRGRQSREAMRRPPVPRPSPQRQGPRPAVTPAPNSQHRQPGMKPGAPHQNGQPGSMPGQPGDRQKPGRRQK